LVDLNRSVLIASRTGRVILGSEKTVEAVKSGRGRLVIVSSNCPKETIEDITSSANLSGMMVYTYPGSAFDLGEACGKPFAVAVMVIREPGDSDILELVGEETGG
jgi:large subunit ribosomal protein L30e